jgi:hypothetical protein
MFLCSIRRNMLRVACKLVLQMFRVACKGDWWKWNQFCTNVHTSLPWKVFRVCPWTEEGPNQHSWTVCRISLQVVSPRIYNDCSDMVFVIAQPLQGQVFHLIVVNPWAQYILEIKWLKVGWKENPSLCWALTYWSTGTQHIPYSIFNHARIFMFMGQWIGSATVKFPVLSLCPRRLLGHRGAWLEWRFSEE